MRGPLLAIACFVTLPLLAGCLATDPGPPEPAPLLRVGTPTETELAARTVDAPPELYLGQWWQYRFYHVRTGISSEVTLVVAGYENDTVLIGMPADAFDDAVMVTHVPPIGIVDPRTWGWDVHERHFAPLQFPLREGDSWETGWQNPEDDVTATVMSVDGQNAHIDMVGATRHITAHYDAKLAALRRLDVEGYGGFEYLASGYEHAGPVVVPYGHQPLLMESRVAGVTDGANNPVPPTATYELSGPYTAMSLLLMAGPQIGETPGAYRLEATGPNGQQFTHLAAPPESFGVTHSIYHSTNVAGTWQATWAMAGPGFGFFEGIGYEARTIELAAKDA